MQSGQISQRELLTDKIMGQDIRLEYNFQQCQKQCSENSVLSKLSEDFFFDHHDSRNSNQVEINVKDSIRSSLQSSMKGSMKGSLKYGDQIMLDKPVPKIQSAFSRRKIFNSPHQISSSSRNVPIAEKEKGIIHVIKRYWLAKRFINNMIKNTYILSNNLKIKLDEDLYSFTKSKSQDQGYMNQNATNDFLMPASRFIRYWDFFSIVMNLVSFFIALFIFSFQSSDGWELTPIEAFIFIFVIADCMVDSRRAIIVQGEIIISKPLIFQNYKQKQAIEDIFYSLCWALVIGTANHYNFANEIITIILVSISLKKLYKKYSNYIDTLYLIGAANSALYDLFTIIISIMFFAHTMACIWHYIGLKTITLEQSWLINYDLVDASVVVRYNYSFYWATMTMVTVGYGDITPQNQWEMLFANILMLCSSCMFAYSMNSIGIIVKNLYDTQLKFKRSLIQINTYMNKHHVTQNIQEKIRNFIKFQLQKQLDDNQEELNSILSNLPPDLINELNSDIQSQIIQKIHILKQFTQQAQNKFAQNLVSQQFTPGDIIYHKNDDNNNLYFIEEGEAEIFQEQTGKVVFTLSQGECFGFHSFFTGQPTEFSIRSVGFSQVYRLTRQESLKIVQLTAKDWELFHHTKDNMIFNNDYSALNIICKFCKNYGHLTNRCQKISYQPNLENVYKKYYIEEIYQERDKDYQRLSEKMNSLRLSGLIVETINQYNKLKKEEDGDTVSSKLSEPAPKDRVQEFIKLKTTYEDKKLEFLSSELNSSRMLQRGGRQQRNSIQYHMPSSNLNNNNLNNTTTKELPSVIAIMESNLALNSQKSCPFCLHENKSEDIDKVKSYTDYMPQNNITTISGIYNNLIFNIIPQDILTKLYKYTFNYKVVSLIAGIRAKLMNRKLLLCTSIRLANKNNQLTNS